MKKIFSWRKIAAIAAAAALTMAGCSNASGSGAGGGQSQADMAAAAAKVKYLAMAGTWTKIDSQGKTNTLVIDSEKATLTFDNAGDYKSYFGEGTRYAAPKTTYSEYSMFLSEGKGVSTLGAATREAISLHPDYSQDLTTAVSSLMAGTGRNFNENDVCLYNVCTSKKNPTTKRNPYVFALALRVTAEGKLEAMFFYSALKDSSPSFEETYSITFDKENSGGGSGGSQGSGELNFSVYGDWKKQGETRIGWHIQINSNGTFDMFQNDQVTAKYINRKASINGNRIELSYVMSNNTDMSQKDTFEVSGSASQMKWTLVSSVTTYQSTSNPDTNHSTLLQNMFGLSSSDYPAKEMTFVPN